MIEVQKFDGSFVAINPSMIVTMECDKTKIVKDDNNVEYNVNDFVNATKATITFVTGDKLELSKLGMQILRQRMTRADFDPEYYKHSIRMLRHV